MEDLNFETKVLIVDDDRMASRIIESILKKKGYHTTLAGTGKEALEKSEGCFFNLALLDIMLPDMEGIDLIEPLKVLHPDTELVMVTAHSSHERAIIALNKGASGYITKPVKPINILNIIRQVLEKQQLVFKNRQLYQEVQRELAEKIKLAEKLKQANKTIIEQQNVLIEEERLKVLLQMAGATATELNQPLYNLLENIEFLRMHENEPDRIRQKILEIQKAGKTISDTIGKIQWIQHGQHSKQMKKLEISTADRELNILSVEDEVKFAAAIERMFRKDELIVLHHAENMKESFPIIHKKRIDLILLDFQLPDGNAFDYLKNLEEKDIDIPVIIITGQGDEMIASQLLQAGAYDYLPKASVNKELLYKTIHNTVEKHRLKNEINTAMGKIAEMSTKDALTNLYNRRYFTEVLNREIGNARRYEKDLSFCMVDIDFFKKVNDTYGHVAGDSVLRDTAELLMKTIRSNDIACRYGGEEFAVILPNTDMDASKILGERFRRAIEEHDFKFESTLIKVTVSVGLAFYDRREDLSSLQFVEMADSALYQAKTRGRNKVVVYTAKA